jgi:hypothetical protein
MFDLSKLSPAIRDQIQASPKYRDWFSRKPAKMLGLDTNAKVIKGNKLGFKTAILYLTPANGSGVQVCPMAALALCEAPCLNTAGRGAQTTTQMSRLWRTLFLQQFEAEALAMITREIRMLEKRAVKQGWQLLVRLNGTSDLRWENMGIIEAFPDVQFYDYTKLSNRRNVPANYDLTFSYSGAKAYQRNLAIARAAGMRIAVVFRNRATSERYMAQGFQGLACVDGDDTDIRHLDPKGAAVALYAKGAAKKDVSGFVVD